MNTYRVTFYFKGSRYEEHVTCSSSSGAREAIKARYPGATGISVWSM